MVYFAKMLLINSLMKLGEINISHNFSEIYMGGCIKRISHEAFNIHPKLMYEQNFIFICQTTNKDIYMQKQNKTQKQADECLIPYFIVNNFLHGLHVLRTIIVEFDAFFVSIAWLVKVTSFQRANQTRATQKKVFATVWINLFHRRQCQQLTRLLVPQTNLRLTDIYANGARASGTSGQESEYVFVSHAPSFKGQTETKRSLLIGIVEVLNFFTLIINNYFCI